jgi:tRNA-2-methylthio-N6-dimethylallyladenosine synthase
VGKSDHLHAVHAQAGAERIGQVARVRITGSGANSLAGQVLDV